MAETAWGGGGRSQRGAGGARAAGPAALGAGEGGA